ncbi:N-ethylmaleimide reductase [Ulvibacter sp. MAR_2010_11]|uniref:alkene reductase n=1 Tax=Ulvibacter sp. MAR_2010_11 TaxID=1250229 RepID=UPI000C2B8DAB|nr:alkene reductase [Ulvibacter sp. MAR_2010_11]PKA84015.1 N-ethylmaleimide reductase [Ulvibacter sp. MAR_2010_11]
MKNSKLLTAFTSKTLQLKNHVVMAPMTRSRAFGNVPNDIMATYYTLRVEAGLIITEGVSPSKNGLGYPNIPAIYSEEQIVGWRKIARAVHEKGGKIFLQIMHTGRIAHELNLPQGGEIIGPSAIQAPGENYTIEGPKANGVPREMTKQDIEQTQNEYVQAAKNAITAGFDGIEIHAANGYLPNQFLDKGANQRKDEYGGSVENRCRFVLETTQKIANAIGAEKTGIRISPLGEFNGMVFYMEIYQTYNYLVERLNSLNLSYLHLAKMSDAVPDEYLEELATTFNGVVIFNGGYGYNLSKAEKILLKNDRYLVSIGSPFVSNPDLIKRIELEAELNEVDVNTLYTLGEEGYITYPTLEQCLK